MRSRHVLLALLCISVVASFAACSGSASPTPPATAPPALPGTSWELGLQGGTAPAAQAAPTLTFGTDGTVSGNTTCNNYTGTFTSTGSTLSIKDLNLTSDQSCAPETKAVETDFLASLAGVTGWQAAAVPPDAVPSGAVVLAPVKLVLTGTKQMVFTLR
jgi:heat shock protein HslJ